jgi:MscS family membrane protein
MAWPAVCFTAASTAAVLHAQLPSLAAQPAATSATQAEPAAPSVAPDSPLASVRAYLAAADSGRWEHAARYLLVPAAEQGRAAQLAERLKGVIDSRRVIDLETLSAASEGSLDDGLPEDLEQVGTVAVAGTAGVAGSDEPMRLRRTTDAQGTFWAFSPNTIARVDQWYTALPDRWVREALAGGRFDVLLQSGFFGVLWLHWILLPIIALLAWAIGRVVEVILRRFVSFVTSRTATTLDEQLAGTLGPPISLAIGVLLFALGCLIIQITREAIAVVGVLIRPVMAFALFWALWRTVPVLVVWISGHRWAMHSPSARNVLSIGANLLRGLIAGFGMLVIIAAFGFPIGTALAGLGIGGLALAFGAQKTVENLFGSVALAVDQPFRIGDFVKVDDFVGTVEDVGLRSTRFRTLDRTVVSIPNGKLADQRLESFEVRDRMRLAATIGLTYGTTQSQMKAVLAGLEGVLRDHPRIWPTAMVVKFKEFGASSLDIEIMAWFAVPTWGDFQACREQVLLGFMGVVEAAGTSFAFPTRTVHIVQDSPEPDRVGAPAPSS